MIGEHPNKAGALAEWFTPLRFAGLLALMLCAAFPGVALGAEAWYKFDFGVLGYPFIQYQRDCFWRGELPLWNPLSNCGAPFLAQWGTMVLYPPSLIYLLLPLPWSLHLFCLLHLLLGGMGMYFLARRWTGNQFAAAAGGTVFVFNGIMLSCLIWPNYLAVLAWMPWLVLTAERAWREGGRWIITAGLVGALQVLTGSPEIVLFTWLVLVAMAAGVFYLKQVPAKTLLPRIALISLIIAGLTAAQLLPFYDLLEHSQRDRTFATTKWAMPGWGWGNLLVPLFHYFMTPQGYYFQTDQGFLSSYYMGAAVLTLAVLAAWHVRARRVWLLAGVTLFGLIMALGENGLVYSLLRKAMPVMGIARYPIKFILLLALTMPLLAAYGWRWCLEAAEHNATALRKSLLTAGGVMAALTLGILWFASQNRFPYDQWPMTGQNTVVRLVSFGLWAGLLVWLAAERRWPHSLLLGLGVLLVPAVDALTHQPMQNPTLSAAVYTPGSVQTEIAFNPLPEPGKSRVFITPFVEDQLLRSNIPSRTNDFLVKRFTLWSNLNTVEGIPKLNGSSTLQIKEQSEVQKLLYATNGVELPKLLDFLAVSHSTPINQLYPWTNRSTALPWITAGQKPVKTESTLAALTNAAFDPKAEVYLNDVTGLNAQPARAAISRLIMKANSKEFVVTSEANTVVVIAETFYHPWRAFVDEQPVALMRANHAFQALAVPAGLHRVRLEYHDARFIIGAWISLATLAGCAGAWIWSKRRGN